MKQSAPLRLAGARWLALKHGWPVRWAHHPLCSRHRHETWKLGRLYLCRGCASLGAGLFGASALVWTVGWAWCGWALALLGPLVLWLSWPPWYARLPRLLRDGLRVGLGVAMVATTAVIAANPLTAWPLLPAVLGCWWWFRRTRTRVQARRCDGCPELGTGICSGFRLHAGISRTLSAELEARLEARWRPGL